MQTNQTRNHRHLIGAALIFRIRAKAAAKATAQSIKSLHDGQPLVAANATFLCNAYVGAVRVDLYGTHTRVRARVIVDLDDAAIAGTQISLRDSLSQKQWMELHYQAQIAIEEAA
ncbi:hypothetical protein [Ralstonia pickettii]|uniref:hypothetical protein n=1 Tax=Ralstonia pickettii TaxID=329 RepID=UPI0015F98525|nr:hypothetical protein [Ralstonia pickettii]MBB0026798.1 hypothetical protein [Ralstonia pickettii]MBB0034704.1 hypothetical protein [Ralstonia pickettii]MBB0099961.1 hypothetical protein [Ralstonia pickettii]MBB0109920.1 hypothetical protein [Ralstonia pickettii]MBB0130900.1 hypothetical protein [Ralstonia pickettii]